MPGAFPLLLALLAGAGLTAGRAAADPAPPEPLQAAVAAMPMPEAGAHPRVLFTRSELPLIRTRAQTPGGQKAVADIAWQADRPGRVVLDNVRAGKPETAENLVVHAFHQAFLHLVTEEPARLANAKELLGGWSAQHATNAYYNRHAYQFALTYDWLYHELPPDIRDAMRGNIAASLPPRLDEWETRGYYRGSMVTGRPCDWGAIDSGGAAMLWLAIAGEDPRASRDFFQGTVDFMRYIADLGLTAEGYLNAGNGYAGGDFVNYGYAVRALQVHGVPLADHPHLQAMAVWLAYESIPGQYVFDTRSFSGGHHQGLSPLVMTLAARHGGAAAWLADQARGPDRTGSIGVPGVLWGEWADAPVPPPELPLHHGSSSMGASFSRSGWNEGSYFCLSMEPVVPGKTHSDKGSFTFYSHGQNFAADPGVGFPNSEDHQTVLIDGKGQHNSGGMTTTDAIPRGFLATKLVDFNHLDVKPAYERHLAYTRTRPGPVEFGRLEYGRGLPFRWEVFRPMERADRYGLYVRGLAQPYVVILDDIQQDQTERQYQWLMHSRAQGVVAGPGHARYHSRYGGEYVQAEKQARVAFTAELPAAGSNTVYALVRKWPQLKNVFSHHVGLAVNGRATHFRPADYLEDWQWVTAGGHALRAGKNEAAITTQRGLWVAQVVAIPGSGLPPERMVDGRTEGETPAGMIVFQRQPDLNIEEWSAHRAPLARMDLHFLHPGAGKLELDYWKKPRAVPVALRAGQRAIRAGFAAVLIPYDDRDPAPVWSQDGDGPAALSWGPYTDYLLADPAHTAPSHAAASLRTDGKFALVRMRDEAVVAYALIAGTTLRFRDRLLVSAGNGPLHVVHDGETCTVRAPAGGSGQVARLQAAALVCNRQAQTLGADAAGMVPFGAPAPAARWDTQLSPDGRLVTVEGAGPLPLKIHAPRAVQCVVNGVSVWFSRDGFGHIYPKIELTELTHGQEPLRSTPSDAVAEEAKPGPSLAADIPLPRDAWRFSKDAADAGREQRWFDIAFDDQGWAPIGIGDFWDSFGVKYTGFAWYRRTFTLPEQPAGAGKVELAFDAVDEMAWVWLNGEPAGAYFEFGPSGWTEPFSFDVTRLVRWGAENQITVRVQNTAAGGGIYKPVALRVFTAAEAKP